MSDNQIIGIYSGSWLKDAFVIEVKDTGIALITYQTSIDWQKKSNKDTIDFLQAGNTEP